MQEVLVVANDSILCITSDGAQICAVAETPIAPNAASHLTQRLVVISLHMLGGAMRVYMHKYQNTFTHSLVQVSTAKASSWQPT